MEAILQFLVLFSGPLGMLGLLAVVVVIWTVRTWRRERPPRELEVIAGSRVEEASEASAPTSERRPALRVVSGRPERPRGPGPGAR